MRNALLAAAAGAALAAGVVMLAPSSGNQANAQATPPTLSKEQAQCILHHLAKASTDRAALLLQSACTSIHTEKLGSDPA